MKIKKLFAIPRSLVICVRLFGISGGVKLPMLIANDVRIKGLHRGSVTIDNPQFLGVKIGFDGSHFITANKGMVIITGNGNINFKGTAIISRGTAIAVSGKLEFGNRYYNNKNCRINCCQSIIFGDDALLGWDVSITDSDGHTVMKNHVPKLNVKRIKLGHHVWIAACASLMKGVEVGDHSIVSYGSIVFSQFSESNVLIGGYPAKIIQNNVDWKL